MTDLQTCIDQNCPDLSDDAAVLTTITEGSPSIWTNYCGSEPKPDPTLFEVQAAISVLLPIRAGREWRLAVIDGPLGVVSSENKTVAVLKAEVAEFNV